MSEPLPLGAVGWVDLTVEDADTVRDFYRSVVGWSHQEVAMGDYADYAMVRPDGTPVAGVCWRRGPNTGLPPVWLVYFTVADLVAATAAVEAAGGEVLVRPKAVGGGQYAVIRDPAGAVCALYQVP
jgi:predicted enzyme related to lactoylglutathione lyase